MAERVWESTPGDRAPRTRVRRVVQVAALLGASTLLGLLVAELALRCLWPQPGYGFPRGLFVSQPGTFYGLHPGVTMRCDVAGRSFDVRVNSLGMRGGEPRPERVERRVLLLGDSTTFGFGVEEQETFAARVQESERARGPIDVEVLNAGVPGYSTFQSLANLRRLGHLIDPDVVVLGFYEGNDFTDNLRARHPRVVDGVLWGGSSPALREDCSSGLAKWIDRARFELSVAVEQCHLVRLMRRVCGGEAASRTSLAAVMAEDRARPFLRQAWQKTRAALDEMLAETRRTGATFVLMALPGSIDFERVDSPAKARMARLAASLRASLGAWAGERRVAFVSPDRELREAARSGPVLLEADRHFNARGHAVQARALARVLDRVLLAAPAVVGAK